MDNNMIKDLFELISKKSREQAWRKRHFVHTRSKQLLIGLLYDAINDVSDNTVEARIGLWTASLTKVDINTYRVEFGNEGRNGTQAELLDWMTERLTEYEHTLKKSHIATVLTLTSSQLYADVVNVKLDGVRYELSMTDWKQLKAMAEEADRQADAEMEAAD